MHKLLPLLLLCALPCFAQKNYPPIMPNAEAQTYKEIGDVSLKLYVFKPEGWKASDKRPGVVFFFGGGWKAGSPQQFEPYCEFLASKGMVAITADYRVASRHQTLAKDCVDDARDAMHWTRANASKLGLDPNRLAAGGGSAGGHIAACLGTIFPEKDPKASIPNALFLFNPACMLAPMKGQPWKDDPSKELRARMGVDPVELSPVHHVSKQTPPSITFHGKADPVVPYFTAELFTEKSKALGINAVIKGYEEAGHGFFNKGRKGPNYHSQTLAELEAFIVELGWIAAD